MTRSTVSQKKASWHVISRQGPCGGMNVFDRYSGTVGGANWSHLSDVIRTSINPSGWREPTPFNAENGGSVPVTANWNWSIRLDKLLNCDGVGVRSATARETAVTGTACFISPPTYGQLMLDSTALIRAMKKAKSSFNAPMTALDGRKTGGMILGAANELASFFGSKTAGRVLRSRRTLSSTWLESQFGWAQLLSDIVHGSLELDRLIMGHDGAGRILVFRGGFLPPETTIRTSPSYLGIPSWDRDFHITPVSHSLTTIRQVHRAVLRYQVENPGLYTAQRLGITNPAFLAWDRVPYSFVLDWMTNIGAFLQVLDTGMGLKYLSGTLSCKEDRTIQTFERNLGKQRPDIFQFVSSNYNGSGSSTSSRYRRDVIVDPLSAVFKHFSFWKKDFSPEIWHYLTSLALLRK